MKTTDYAVNYVYSILKEHDSGIDYPVYKYRKPTQSTHTAYIVINALPISAGVLQTTRVNVNFHCADTFDGVPDTVTLEEATSDLMALLTEVSDIGILIDFESQEYIQEKELNEHYSNIRLFIKIIS
jgi:hypothetical protein